jgi:hypothetical protein
VYRYTGNNPVNATDPSGMTAARERQAIDGIGLALIRGGAIATRSMLSTGTRTAQFLARQDKVALSAIAGRIACNLFILADAVAQAGPNTRIVGVNSATCGVAAISVPDRDDKPSLWPPPIIPQRGLCSCRCGVVAGRDVINKPPARFAIWIKLDNPSCKSTAVEACRIAKKRIAVETVHHQGSLCRYNNGNPFPVK